MVDDRAADLGALHGLIGHIAYSLPNFQILAVLELDELVSLLGAYVGDHPSATHALVVGVLVALHEQVVAGRACDGLPLLPALLVAHVYGELRLDRTAVCLHRVQLNVASVQILGRSHRIYADALY